MVFFTANLGNLRPGERFTVSMHFVQIIDWHHDGARLLFPTTIAPRYGEAQAAGQVALYRADTGTSITAEYGFELDVLVRGWMASAVLESPSPHSISQIPEEAGSVRIRLRG
jgi:Ca-activated chloride channel family protein